jgi:hypothetical protein
MIFTVNGIEMYYLNKKKNTWQNYQVFLNPGIIIFPLFQANITIRYQKL